MKKNYLLSLSHSKGITIKMLAMNCCWILLLYIGSIFTACSDEDSVKKNPYLSTCTRAMLKEVVEVRFLNLDKKINIHIDFGDGTIKEGMSTDVITHKYTQSGDYTMNITAGEHKIQKRIRIYNLLALTEAMKLFKDPNYKKVWAMTHRAHTTDLTIPENSISSVSAAIKSGAEIIECDTHVTKDGVVVVCHDQTINATTNGSGDITKMTFEEIQKYYLKDRNGNLTDEKIPTLEAFLKAGRGKIYFNLDYSPRTASTKQVFDIVKKMEMMESVFFYCNSEQKVKEVLDLDKDAHAYPWVGAHKALVGLPGAYFIQGSYMTNGKSTDMSKGIADGMIVSIGMLAWTGSDVSEYELNEEYLDDLLTIFPDVKMIMTDVPKELIKALKQRGKR